MIEERVMFSDLISVVGI